MSNVVSFKNAYRERNGVELVDSSKNAKPHYTDDILLKDKLCPKCGFFMPLLRGHSERTCIYCNPLSRK